MIKTAVFEAMMDSNLNCLSIIMSFLTYIKGITKVGRHDIAEKLLKVALSTILSDGNS
jgi:hypothetical protein